MVTKIWEHAGLSLYDRAALSASFYYHWDDRLNCRRARAALMKRSREPATVDQIVRTKFGCDVIAKSPRVTIDSFGYHSCLCQYEHPLFYAYLDLVGRMDAGILPDRGAYLDQPAKTLEAIQLLTHLRAEAQAAEAKKEKQEKARPHGR